MSHYIFSACTSKGRGEDAGSRVELIRCAGVRALLRGREVVSVTPLRHLGPAWSWCHLKMFTGILTQPTGDGFLLAALVPGGQLRVEEEDGLRVEQTRPVQRAGVRGGGGHSSDMQ